MYLMSEEEKKKCLVIVRNLIDQMGSSLMLSKAIGVTPGAVSSWKSGRSVPSAIHALKIQQLTKGKIRREDLRPDVKW